MKKKDNLDLGIDIPIPEKKYTALDENDIKVIELLEQHNKRLHILYRQFILIFTIVLIVDIISFYLYFSNKTHSFAETIILVIIVALSILFLFFSTLLGIIRLIWDRKKLKEWIILKWWNSFIIAHFLNDTKRIETQLCLVKNSNEIYYDKGLYFVSNKTTWQNMRRQPENFYVKGFPNPLDFKYTETIKNFFTLEGIARDQAKNPDGTPLDVSFDSETTKSFKEMKITNEMTKDISEKNPLTLVLIIMIIAIVAIVALFLFKFGGGGNNLHMVNETVARGV